MTIDGALDRSDFRLALASGKELRALTGLRGLCALVVVIAHYDFDQWHWLFTLTMWHNPAVDIFFVLSGFTMFYVHGPHRGPLDFQDFMARRVARLWPLCAFTLVAGSAVAMQQPHPVDIATPHILALDWLRQFLMVNAWPLIGGGVHFNRPQWSVSVEFFLYIFLFPVLYHAAGRIAAASPSVLAACSVLLMSLSCLVFLSWFAPDLTMGLPVEHPASALLSMVARGVCGFTAGCVAFFLCCRRDTPRWDRSSDLVSLLFVIVLVGASLSFWSYQLLVLLAPAIVVCNVSSRSLTGRFLSSRPLRYLGVISYSLYLIHVPLRWYVGVVLNHVSYALSVPLPSEPLVSGVAILVLLPLSALSYSFIEAPSRQRLYRAFRRVPGRTRAAETLR